MSPGRWARFQGSECLDGTAERIRLPDGSLDACIVGSAWHWFDVPAALAEISRVLHDRGRLGVFATSADTGVGWVRGMYVDADLQAQERGADSVRNVTLPSADFARADFDRVYQPGLAGPLGLLLGERWTGRSVAIYEDGTPVEVYFWGFSGD